MAHAARPRRARRILLALLAASSLLAGCGWVALGWGALTYPSAADGDPQNVVVAAGRAYLARGAAGLEIVDLTTPEVRGTASLAGLETVDDLAAADGFLFALDARAPGMLAAYSLSSPDAPRAIGAPIAVDVGPFSGVAAARGWLVVSGGTGRMTALRYDPQGMIRASPAHLDLGRGQPDVALAADGRYAYVSTHEFGPRFSLVTVALEASPVALGRVPLATYGFTPGGAKPANFPIEAAVGATTLYLADADGLEVLDLSDPARPRASRTVELDVRPVNVDADGRTLAVVGSSPTPRLVLLDALDPQRPRVTGSIALPAGSRPTGVALADGLAIVAAAGAGTLVFDRAHQRWIEPSDRSTKQRR